MASWALGESCALLSAKTAALLGFETAAAMARQAELPAQIACDDPDGAAQLLCSADRIIELEGFCPGRLPVPALRKAVCFSRNSGLLRGQRPLPEAAP